MRSLKVGLVQQSCTTDQQKNVENNFKQIGQAAAQGAELVVLQELHNSHYFCQTEDTINFDLAESIPGTTTQKFGELAKELGIVLIISLFEKRT
ncbi:MAG: acyltransferase, partial [Desulfuromusa sp.]|nr:acyltransferase [Desulfuromusa sp.]